MSDGWWLTALVALVVALHAIIAGLFVYAGGPRLWTWWLDDVLRWPKRVISARHALGPYLSRWFLLWPLVPVTEADAEDSRKIPLNLFLHRFHRSDDDSALHSHPWRWALSFVFWGGYWEERRGADDVVRRRLVMAPAFNFIRSSDYHRVDLVEGKECWSLFAVGRKCSTWFFWDETLKARINWKAYFGMAPGQWECDSRVPSRDANGAAIVAALVNAGCRAEGVRGWDR